MTASALPAKTPRRGARTRAAWFATLALSATACAVAGPCAGNFTLGSVHRSFDGAEFEVVTLQSSGVGIAAYTLGAWTPVDEPSDVFGTVFRHTKAGGARFGICLLTGNSLPNNPASWKEYVNDLLLDLGQSVTLRDQVDSTTNPKIVGLLGWATREVTFVVPQPEGKANYAEYHVVVCDEQVGVRFVLFGPEAEIEKVRGDFRFFLSRLSRLP